jgi:hypothetical protein
MDRIMQDDTTVVDSTSERPIIKDTDVTTLPVDDDVLPGIIFIILLHEFTEKFTTLPGDVDMPYDKYNNSVNGSSNVHGNSLLDGSTSTSTRRHQHGTRRVQLPVDDDVIPGTTFIILLRVFAERFTTQMPPTSNYL